MRRFGTRDFRNLKSTTSRLARRGAFRREILLLRFLRLKRGGASQTRPSVFYFLFSVLSLLCLLAAFPAQAELTAGAAKIDMTPDTQHSNIPLGGYAARRGAAATGVHDPVFARALTLADGSAKICFVSVDLCFLPANLKAEVVRRVAAAGIAGMDAAHLLISATHTHAGPDPLAMHTGNRFSELKNWPRFDAALLDYTADRIASAVIEADGRRVPAKAGFRKANLRRRHLNRNRRGERTIDSEITLLKVTTRNGAPLANVFNFAAHPTLYDATMMQISADWPGVATESIERNSGNGGGVCLFLNGDEGDATVSGATGYTAEERAANYGETMARTVLELTKKIKTSDRLPVTAWTQRVSLPSRRPNPLFLIAAGQLGATFGEANALVNSLMPTETTLAFAKIGNLLFIAFPCEPTGDIGIEAKRLARRAGYKTSAVVALTNDWLAYCVTPAQYRAGKYEASMSFYGDSFGPAMLTAVQQGLSVRR